MKTKKFGAVIATFIFGTTLFAQTINSQDAKQTVPAPVEAKKVPASYYCSVHPGEKMKNPGNCQKCGKQMVKRSNVKIYSCPMHLEVESLKGGLCPICGRPLENIAYKTKVEKAKK